MPDNLDQAQSQHNFAFVMNVGNMQGIDSFELAEGHVLRRANDFEMEAIRWGF